MSQEYSDSPVETIQPDTTDLANLLSVPKSESEYYYLVVRDDIILRWILTSDTRYLDDVPDPTNEQEFRNFISRYTQHYSALTWTSFITNIGSFCRAGFDVYYASVLYSFINTHIKELTKDMSAIKLEYITTLYMVARRVKDETKLFQPSFSSKVFNEILQTTIDIIDDLIWEADINDSILPFKSLVAIDKANRFKTTPLYDELIAVSYCDVKRMMDNGLFNVSFQVC